MASIRSSSLNLLSSLSLSAAPSTVRALGFRSRDASSSLPALSPSLAFAISIHSPRIRTPTACSHSPQTKEEKKKEKWMRQQSSSVTSRRFRHLFDCPDPYGPRRGAASCTDRVPPCRPPTPPTRCPHFVGSAVFGGPGTAGCRSWWSLLLLLLSSPRTHHRRHPLSPPPKHAPRGTEKSSTQPHPATTFWSVVTTRFDACRTLFERARRRRLVPLPLRIAVLALQCNEKASSPLPEDTGRPRASEGWRSEGADAPSAAWAGRGERGGRVGQCAQVAKGASQSVVIAPRTKE